ncbi:hypothetical protein A2U01_0095871, partial [Trifolium medium]|nr:hypothetical protein [Trifolium medium]
MFEGKSKCLAYPIPKSSKKVTSTLGFAVAMGDWVSSDDKKSQVLKTTSIQFQKLQKLLPT